MKVFSLVLVLVLLVTLCLPSVVLASEFDQKEIDPTQARGEKSHALGFDHHGQPSHKYNPINTEPRRVWSKEEADEFFGHPSVQGRPEFEGLKNFLYDNGFHASKLQLRWDINQGYYFVATKQANMLEELLSVPGNMFFHIFNPRLQNGTKYMLMRLNEYFWAPGLESEIEDLARVSLVIALMAETRNPNSFWAPYLAILQKPVLPFMLNDDELNSLELNRNTQFLRSKQRLFEDFARVVHCPEFAWVQKEQDLLDWAIATVGSRTFSWGLGKFGNHLVMMPGMDFINHNNDVGNHYEYTENQDLRYLVPSNIQPGDELYIAYMPHATNFYLYTEYGFMLPRNPQDHMVIEFNGDLANILQKNTYDLPKLIIVGYDDHIPYKFIRAVNVAVLNGEDAVTLGAYDALIAQLEADLAKFSTTKTQDEQEVATLGNEMKDKRRRLVLTMRIEAKRLLENVIEAVKGDRAQYNSKGIDGVLALRSKRQPSDVYLDEPLRVVKLADPSTITK